MTLMEQICIIASSSHLLFIAQICSLALKIYISICLFIVNLRLKNKKKFCYLLLAVVFGSMTTDISWLVRAMRTIFSIPINYKVNSFTLFLAWAFYVVQYQSLAIFLEFLIDKYYKLTKRDIFFCSLTAIQSLIYFCYAIMLTPYCVSFEDLVQNYPFFVSFFTYCLKFSGLYIFIVLTPSLYKAIQKIQTNSLPFIVNQQLKVLINFIIIPQLFVELLIYKIVLYIFAEATPHVYVINYVLNGISTIFVTLAIYFCYRKMLGLRFLNYKDQVEPKVKFPFIHDIKNALNRLGNAKSPQELLHITQTFFYTAFGITLDSTSYYMREAQFHYNDKSDPTALAIMQKVENFLTDHPKMKSVIGQILHSNKIFIKDELAFTNFYEEDATCEKILSFLDSINADVFLPVFEYGTITSYIIVKSGGRPNKLYSSVDRDEMLVFADYLGSTYSTLKALNHDLLLKEIKELKEEVHYKHQEVNHYKESMRSFFSSSVDRKIGLVFYKSREFTLANPAAKDLISVDINKERGHYLTQAFHLLLQRIADYKCAQSIYTRDAHDVKIMLSGVPNGHAENVTIMVYYPEISDFLKKQFDVLKDPSAWDYLLYLETTKAGQLINQLIPSNGTTLFNFKINLLKAALSKKAILLEMAEDDLLSTVEILHHISGRQFLHTLRLTVPEKNSEIAIKLFGGRPILGLKDDSSEVVKKLDNCGTLFIQNIDFVSMTTQSELAEFITYGFYHHCSGDHKYFSNVRVICSSTASLQTLVAENRFSRALYAALEKTTLKMPTFDVIPENELNELVDGFTRQSMRTDTYKNILQLNNYERAKLFEKHFVSMHAFKEKVYNLIVEKAEKNNISESSEFDTAFYARDPKLTEIAHLGVKAVDDPQLMKLLWEKFGSQTRIAEFLGVNKSTISRRCKMYNLGQAPPPEESPEENEG